VGDEDPVRALQDVLQPRRRVFSEVIVATPPAGISRWFHHDLPHRVEHATALPITTILTTEPVCA
jgi:hypothetical protein